MWHTSRLPPDELALARVARVVTLAGALALVLLLTRGRPWELFGEGLYTSSFYDVQADRLWRLRLDVPREVAAIEGFEIGSRTYLYFGPFLAIVRLPSAWIPGIEGRLSAVMTLAGYVVLASAAFHLLLAGRRLVARRTGTPPVNNSMRTALGMAAVVASPVLFLGAERTVYHETEMWGAALALVTAALVVRTAADPSRAGVIAAAGAAAACILTRASVGTGAVVAVGVLAIALRTDGRRRLAAGATAGAIVAFGTHVAVNLAKFGEPLRVPFERQTLTLLDPERAAWLAGTGNTFFKLEFLPTTLLQYLRPDALRLERLVPFVRFGPRAEALGSYPLQTSDRAASLSTAAPLLLVTAMVGLVVLVRWRQWRWLGLFGAAVVGAVPTLTIGFVANRYLVDLVPALVLPAAAAVWLPVRPARGAALVAGGLVALACWTNLGLAWWLQSFRDPGFTDLRYRIDAAVFGDGRPPGVTRDERPPGHDGAVLVAGSCVALYVGDGDAWRVLERPVGPQRRVLVVDGPVDRDRPIASGPTWTVQLAPSGDGRAVVLLNTDDGEAFRSPELPVGAGTTVEIVADRVTREFVVRVDGADVLVQYPSTATGPVEPYLGVVDADPATVDGATAPVCARLAERLAAAEAAGLVPPWPPSAQRATGTAGP
jgi:hypothetical protein